MGAVRLAEWLQSQLLAWLASQTSVNFKIVVAGQNFEIFMGLVVSQAQQGTQHAWFSQERKFYGGYSEGLPLILIKGQVADKANRQQTGYGKQKNNDNHGSRASLITDACEVPS